MYGLRFAIISISGNLERFSVLPARPAGSVDNLRSRNRAPPRDVPWDEYPGCVAKPATKADQRDAFAPRPCSNNELNRDTVSISNRRALDANSCHDVTMLHRISILVAWAMVALSIFFVFRPLQPASRIQPPLGTLTATECVAHPETSAIPREYSCEQP
jgi:hypothetical protein